MNWVEQFRGRYCVTTDPLKSERRLELLALALVALLLLQVVWTVVDLAMPLAPAPVLPTDETLQLARISDRQLVDSAQSAQIRARPLFFEGRRPETQEEEALVAKEPEQKAAGKPPQLKLVGVFGGADTRGIIALQKGKQMRLMVGDDIAGWTLQKVERDRALLNNNGESWSVVLERTDTGISASAVEQPAAEDNGDQKAAPQQNSPDEHASDTLVLGGRR